ncbi:MAG: hypothetical protein M3Z30_02950, partial [Gemmatimonadota bacterium]|nr:hypothetical protein [Gemmatimonadota bacterium]
ELGNTPTICRKSYVHPIVIDRYLKVGDTIVLPAHRSSRTRAAASHSVEERALIEFLDAHFPDRRKKRRTNDE